MIVICPRCDLKFNAPANRTWYAECERCGSVFDMKDHKVVTTKELRIDDSNK